MPTNHCTCIDHEPHLHPNSLSTTSLCLSQRPLTPPLPAAHLMMPMNHCTCMTCSPSSSALAVTYTGRWAPRKEGQAALLWNSVLRGVEGRREEGRRV